jgi:GntR family transcriptional regulator
MPGDMDTGSASTTSEDSAPDDVAPADTAPGIARYLQVAHTLEKAIAGGTYPVGSLIPTEIELAASFGVSRQTVRQAIAHLRQLHLLSARKGVGTRVEAARPQRSYYHALQSLPELFQYAEQTVFRVERSERVTATGRLAADLGCRAGRVWLRLDGPREEPGREVPLCWLTVYVEQRYAAAVEGRAQHTTALFSQIEQHFGEAIVEVTQEIEAVLLTEEDAARLDAKAGGPALLITRRYFAPGRRLVELSVSLHPADRFRYAMTLRRS